jgi:hypothetical protein
VMVTGLVRVIVVCNLGRVCVSRGWEGEGQSKGAVNTVTAARAVTPAASGKTVEAVADGIKALKAQHMQPQHMPQCVHDTNILNLLLLLLLLQSLVVPSAVWVTSGPPARPPGCLPWWLSAQLSSQRSSSCHSSAGG